MAHRVIFSVPRSELGNSDLELSVRTDDGKFGTLKISKGALVWVPRDHQYGYKVSWKKFDMFMTGEGKREG